MESGRWLSYTDLAWLDRIVSPPHEYAEEAAFYTELIESDADGRAPLELLHLGCGAGGHDFNLKRHFTVTGVDLSEEMLEIARERNPEVTYIAGDMRDLDLGRAFDVVLIPDSIDYMASLDDLKRAMITARAHLRPEGALVITAKVREEFRDNNFAYTGAKDGVEVTVLENNHVSRTRPDAYEATLVYLVRQQGELSVHVDVHQLGIFEEATWLALFEEAGFQVRQCPLTGVYEPYILGEGEYPMRVFFAKLKRAAGP